MSSSSSLLVNTLVIVAFVLLSILSIDVQVEAADVVEVGEKRRERDNGILPFNGQFVPQHIFDERQKAITAASLSVGGDPDDNVEILVRYKNEQGKRLIGQMGNNADDSVDKDISMFRTAKVSIQRKRIEALNLDENIESIGVSVHYQALPHTERPTKVFSSMTGRLLPNDDDKQDQHQNGDQPSRKLLRGARDNRSDQNFGEQSPYGISLVQADLIPQGDEIIKVCVVDTGYGNNHPDLPNENDHNVNGHSPYGNNQRWDVDGHGHGTHCAGTIGAIGNNDVGVTSINPDPNKFTFYVGKGLRDSGDGDTDSIIDAVEACVNNGAKVISMSLGCVDEGGGCYSNIDKEAFADIYNRNVLVVAAAGNAGNHKHSYPASYTSVMSVGAVDDDEDIASFSQYNDQVEISAPGVDITSTVTTNHGHSYRYATWSGTSMATPHVAGVAAKLWSNFPSCTNNQIRNVLLRSALDRGDTGCDDEYGYGVLKAKVAYDLLVAFGCEAGGDGSTNDLSSLAKGGCSQYTGPTDRPPVNDDPQDPPPPPPPVNDDPQDPQPPNPRDPNPRDPQDPSPPNPRDPNPRDPQEPPQRPPAPPVDEDPESCSDDEDLVTVSILTDFFGEETEWSIYLNSGYEVAGTSRGTYGPDRSYVETYCIPKIACTFEIRDYPVGYPEGRGDGICCGQFGNGEYFIERNGKRYDSPTGGEFGFKEEIHICDDDDDSGQTPPPPPPNCKRGC